MPDVPAVPSPTTPSAPLPPDSRRGRTQRRWVIVCWLGAAAAALLAIQGTVNLVFGGPIQVVNWVPLIAGTGAAIWAATVATGCGGWARPTSGSSRAPRRARTICLGWLGVVTSIPVGAVFSVARSASTPTSGGAADRRRHRHARGRRDRRDDRARLHRVPGGRARHDRERVARGRGLELLAVAEREPGADVRPEQRDRRVALPRCRTAARGASCRRSRARGGSSRARGRRLRACAGSAPRRPRRGSRGRRTSASPRRARRRSPAAPRCRRRARRRTRRRRPAMSSAVGCGPGSESSSSG